MYQAIYFADAVTGKCPEVSGAYFPNYNLTHRQLYSLPEELVLSYRSDGMCRSIWVIEKKKLPQVMAHIYPRGAEHYNHSGRGWDWKAVSDSLTGPTVWIVRYED